MSLNKFEFKNYYMKKLLFINFLLLSVYVLSQQKTKYGINAGLNISSFSGSDNEGFSSKLGFHVGGFLLNPISEKISVDTELNYSQLGASFETSLPYFNESSNIVFSGKVKIDYLRLPILFNYHATTNFGLAIGPELGFLLSNKMTYDQEINNSNSQKLENLNQLDIGIKARVNYVFSEHYLVTVGYYTGISKVFKDSTIFLPNSTIVQEAPQINNSYFSVSVGYVF